jgi:hypothetical protein
VAPDAAAAGATAAAANTAAAGPINCTVTMIEVQPSGAMDWNTAPGNFMQPCCAGTLLRSGGQGYQTTSCPCSSGYCPCCTVFLPASRCVSGRPAARSLSWGARRCSRRGGAPGGCRKQAGTQYRRSTAYRGGGRVVRRVGGVGEGVWAQWCIHGIYTVDMAAGMPRSLCKDAVAWCSQQLTSKVCDRHKQ